MSTSHLLKGLSFLVCGILFGAGLAMSGMTNTAKVIGFLDVFETVGTWDIDLLFVMGAAVLVSLVGLKLTLSKDKPLFEGKFHLPIHNVIDKKLVLGAILFGLGWALYGYCPGPAIAALAYCSPVTVLFIICMLIGMFLSNKMMILFDKVFS